MKERITPREKELREKQFLPLIFGKEALLKEEIGREEEERIALFERGLEKELKAGDTIEQAVTKIVKMAIAAEFGVSLVRAKGAEGMIKTITSSILSDSILRRQALILVDRFARQ